MTRRAKSSSQSIKFFRHHSKKVSPENSYRDDDYEGGDDTSQSPSPSPYESNEEDEFTQSVNDDGASYVESEFPGGAPNSDDQLSAQEAEFGHNSDARGSKKPGSVSQQNAQATSYVDVAPLPVFRGTPSECPVTHLSRFNKVCRANNASSNEMMMRIFPVTLENEAALWYDLNIEPYPTLSWDEIKSSFLEAYRKLEVVDQLRSDLMTLNQGGEELVRSYFLRLQWILQMWPENGGLSDELIKGVFIDGLREDFREWILPQKPSSLNEALRLAFNYEQVKSIRPAKIAKVASKRCAFCEGSHDEKECEVRRKFAELWRKRSGSYAEEAGKEKIVDEEAGVDDGRDDDDDDDAKEEGGEMLGGGSKMKRSRSNCQCWKHQCWKKTLGRSSAVTRKPDVE